MTVRIGGKVNGRYGPEQMCRASSTGSAGRGGDESSEVYALVVHTACDRWWWSHFWVTFGCPPLGRLAFFVVGRFGELGAATSGVVTG